VQPRIVLASASPRRRELLAQIGLRFEVVAASVTEAVAAGETAEDYVVRVAVDKARAVCWEAGPECCIVAADTEVVLDGEVFGKPRDFGHFQDMARRLSGREHRVLSAVAVCRGESLQTALSVTTVEFRPLAGAEIDAYWCSGEPADKAGGYAIQGLGAVFVTRLCGSYSGVMGLPLQETAALLQAAGVSVIAEPGSR